jgi:hypothetical protein
MEPILEESKLPNPLLANIELDCKTHLIISIAPLSVTITAVIYERKMFYSIIPSLYNSLSRASH